MDLGDRSEHGGRASTEISDIEAHSGAIQRDSGGERSEGAAKRGGREARGPRSEGAAKRGGREARGPRSEGVMGRSPACTTAGMQEVGHQKQAP
jgi:hypothetical protein